MDTSEKYIKMCEKAEEIQKKWKPQPFDNFTYRHIPEDAPWWWSKLDRFGELNKKRDSHIFLPRQDQLQEIKGGESTYILIKFYNWFCDQFSPLWEESKLHECKFTTMEQLWLAFVMKKKYGKIWDDKKEEWIKYNVR